MQKTTIKIGGMSCEHCVRAVTEAISSIPGIMAVEVSLDDGSASFEYDGTGAVLEVVKSAVIEEGYEA